MLMTILYTVGIGTNISSILELELLWLSISEIRLWQTLLHISLRGIFENDDVQSLEKVVQGDAIKELL